MFIGIDLCFSEDESVFSLFLFLGTTNPKRPVMAEHGAVWGIDDILNYLKEIDDAPCPWRARSAKKAVPACPGRWHHGGRGPPRHPDSKGKAMHAK